jgi:GR25 family glycosyltransferase involved in LPS biosynthesis
VEAYRAYKFALVCENASAPGYVTEKLLHAKLAGCVPIYWGSADVAADFDPAGYINVTDYKTADLLLARIAALDKDHAAWSAMASVPALSGSRLDECRLTLKSMATAIMDIKPLITTAGAGAGAAAAAAGASAFKEQKKIPSYDLTHIKEAANQVIVTCCNGKFISSALKLIKSSPVPVYVWVWDVDFMDVKKLTKAGAAQVIPLDTKWNPHWDDFWNPAHYAWKSLVMVLANSCLPAGTRALYLDAGVEVVGDLGAIWTAITADNFFICKMPEHKMRTWCHPKFCSTMSITEAELDGAQVSANIVGFTVGNEKATGILSQVLGLACNPDVIVGHKWHAYSAVCKGHRHDQSILSLICLRTAGLLQHLLDDFAGWQSKEATVKAGAVLYVHRGAASTATTASATAATAASAATAATASTATASQGSELKGISDAFVVNLEHRKDRLEQFFHNQPYMKCKRLEAINGRTLTLNKDICRLFVNNDFKWKKSVMGCALSHFGLWKHIAETGPAASYLILEDDAVLCADFVGKWNSIAGLVPSDSDIIFLGGVLPPNKPALPMVTEPVNAAFARVAVNEVFGSRRRYFHFCTYSYIITTAGATKLCRLIQERGLYTSADHMLVNNMDLLNVYFTTPLLAGCVQDSDPVYQKADFNNFARVDKFDSEIWNNADAFTQEEVATASASASTVAKPLTVIYFEEGQQKQCIDSQWLRAIFQREFLWISVSDASTSVSDAATSATTGEVLLYYQHTTPVSVIEGWINRNVDRTIYLLHASDESCTADISIYNHPAIKCVFRNYWRPDCCGRDKVVTLPLGYLDGKGLSGSLVIASGRLYDWSFAGATDRNGRLEALAAIKQWRAYPKHKLHLTPTWGSAANLDAAAYAAILQQSRFVPCLDGFYNTESYRFYEALEAGAVPVIYVDEKETYKNILGLAPLVTVSSWSSPVTISDWDAKQKELFSWWQSFKQSLSALVQSKFV